MNWRKFFSLNGVKIPASLLGKVFWMLGFLVVFGIGIGCALFATLLLPAFGAMSVTGAREFDQCTPTTLKFLIVFWVVEMIALLWIVFGIDHSSSSLCD